MNGCKPHWSLMSVDDFAGAAGAVRWHFNLRGRAFSCISTFNDTPGGRASAVTPIPKPRSRPVKTPTEWMKTRRAKNRFAERPVCCVVRIDPGRVVSHRLGEDSPHPLPFSQLFRCNPCRSFWYGPGVIKVSCRSRLKNKILCARMKQCPFWCYMPAYYRGDVSQNRTLLHSQRCRQ